MRRLVPMLAIAAGSLGVPLVSAGPATALGGETFGCIVSPSHATSPTQSCWTNLVSGTYSIGYTVQNLSGSYTYAWTLPPAGTYSLNSGCNSGSYFCDISVRETAADRDIAVSVTLYQGGSQATLTSSAFIPAGCGSELC